MPEISPELSDAPASGAPWFASCSERSRCDFFDLCTQRPDALAAAMRALERAGGTLPSGDLAQEVADLHARLSCARDGAWQPYEQYLRTLGARHARTTLPLSAWYGIAGAFSNVVMAQAVVCHASDPARLTAVLVMVTELVERSLSIIAMDYYAAKHQREREVTARHRRMIDAAIDAVIEMDEAGIVTEFNPAAERAFGYCRAQAVGQPLASLIIPEPARAQHLAGVARYLAGGEARMVGRRIEIMAMRRDGSELPVELALVATDRFDGGRGFIGFLRDLTEHRRTQQSLARSAGRLQTLSETGHELASASGQLEDLLELVARRLGEIIGDGCAVRLISGDGDWLEPSASFYHRDPERRAVARHVLATERQRVGEGLAGRAAATGQPVLVRVLTPEQVLALAPVQFQPMFAQIGPSSALAIPLRSHGKTIGAISLFRSEPGQPYTIDDQRFAQDLADRAGLAIDNAVLVATLEDRVTERTAALEAVNRELEAFSYSVSHDLRAPLRAIDGFSKALLTDYEAALDDDARRYLQRIRSATQRMGTLIDDLLNLARISRTSLKLAVHDLSAVARDVITELQRRDPERAVTVHISPGLSARADLGMLRIVLENLLGNAWKFTAKHDHAEIWFGAHAEVFHVRDTGAGFDMAYADKLFAPFQRLHAAKDFDGTGIGLAIVQRIIAHHGGRIWAEAAVGKGATFYFTLGGGHGQTAMHPAR